MLSYQQIMLCFDSLLKEEKNASHMELLGASVKTVGLSKFPFHVKRLLKKLNECLLFYEKVKHDPKRKKFATKKLIILHKNMKLLLHAKPIEG